jgi:hypothetical protein
MRHVVLFRFQPDTAADRVIALAEGLAALPGAIPEIVDYRFGPDLAINEASWDFAVSADFADTAGYLAYRDHPQHQQLIAELVLPIVADRASVQFRT